jgi:hypothetical protein
MMISNSLFRISWSFLNACLPNSSQADSMLLAREVWASNHCLYYSSGGSSIIILFICQLSFYNNWKWRITSTECRTRTPCTTTNMHFLCNNSKKTPSPTLRWLSLILWKCSNTQCLLSH